jgi:hypothetical protein
VPTSSPGRRIAAFSPPSTRLPVPWAIELVPTMPRSWPVAAYMALIGFGLVLALQVSLQAGHFA